MNNSTTRESSKLGIGLCLMTASIFGCSIVMAKLAYGYGMSPLTFGAARAFAGVVVCLGMAIALKSPWRLPPSASSEVLPITFIFLMIAFGYPLAMKYIPASIASLIFYLFPLIVLAIGSFKERRFPGIKRILIYLTAFVGLGIVLGPSLEGLQWQGVVAGLVAAMGAALFTLKIPKIMSETNGMVLNVYANALNVVVLLGAAWAFDMFMFPSTPEGWLVAALSGIFYGVATAMVVFAVNKTGPALASIFFNVEPMVVAILAALLFAEFLSLIQYMGMVIVVGALMFASLRSSR